MLWARVQGCLISWQEEWLGSMRSFKLYTRLAEDSCTSYVDLKDGKDLCFARRIHGGVVAAVAVVVAVLVAVLVVVEARVVVMVTTTAVTTMAAGAAVHMMVIASTAALW